jgi:hypothetical protein
MPTLPFVPGHSSFGDRPGLETLSKSWSAPSFPSIIQMTGEHAAFISRERVVLDGVPYTISVYARNNVYLAKWFCGGCGNQSELRFESLTTAEPVEAAKANLAIHHASMHTRSAR